MVESVETAKDTAPVKAGVAAKATAVAPPVEPPNTRRGGLVAALSLWVPSVPVDLRMAAVATAALAAGIGLGLLAVPHDRSSPSLVRIEASLEAEHDETTRINAEIKQLGRTLALIRETSEATRGESRSQGATVTARLTQLEQSLDRRLAALADKPALGDHDTITPPSTPPVQSEKRTVPPVATASPTTGVAAVATSGPEPIQTASIAETRSKPNATEAWALREVYDGIAMLEDRKRRLVEVVPGDSLPGVGRVEAIERRGRTWVVVTQQGLITPQTW